MSLKVATGVRISVGDNDKLRHFAVVNARRRLKVTRLNLSESWVHGNQRGLRLVTPRVWRPVSLRRDVVRRRLDLSVSIIVRPIVGWGGELLSVILL